MKLRVKFSKFGPLRYVGHLDIMRFFQKAVRRSGIPICYSTGFSPHQIMSFAAPLGFGQTSEREYFEIEVESITSSEEMRNALDSCMAEGIKIEGIRLLPDTAKNAMASIQAASYRITLKDVPSSIDMASLVEEFLLRKEIFVVKETKKSIIERDIRPAVFELSLMESKELSLLVDASSAGNLKPAAVIEAMFEKTHFPTPRIHVVRIDTFTRDEAGDLVSLGEVGSIF